MTMKHMSHHLRLFLSKKINEKDFFFENVIEYVIEFYRIIVQYIGPYVICKYAFSNINNDKLQKTFNIFIMAIKLYDLSMVSYVILIMILRQKLQLRNIVLHTCFYR